MVIISYSLYLFLIDISVLTVKMVFQKLLLPAGIVGTVVGVVTLTKYVHKHHCFFAYHLFLTIKSWHKLTSLYYRSRHWLIFGKHINHVFC